MNKSKMDNMFREKLYDHKVMPRSEAWTKLKGNLDSDRKKILLIYWRVAAIIILLLASVFFVYKIKNTDLTHSFANKQEEVKPQVTDKNNTGQAKQDSQIAGRHDMGAGQSQSEKIVTKSSEKQAEIKQLAQGKTITPTKQVEKPKPDNPPKSQALAAAHQTLETSTDVNTANEQKSTHIETVKPIRSRSLPNQETGDLASVTMLDKHRDLDDTMDKSDLPNITITFKKDEREILKEPFADNEELSKVKKFALKKVINLAKDIRAGEVGISTLREKKDELLAFNFNKKKNVKNSK